MVTVETMPQGICPSCGLVVAPDDVAVWTCRFNLSPKNGYYRATPFSDYELDCMRSDPDSSSLCLDDLYGELGACEASRLDNHVPLHEACYENGDY